MSKTTLSPQAAAWLSETFARNTARFGGWRMEADPATDPESGAGGGTDQTFTQADVDRIVAERLKREREATKTKYADYDELKAKAEGAKTAEDRIADLEKSIEAANREAMRRRVQAAHGISDEDADLFLTGTDEDSLTAQAKRLADRETERKRKNNVSPREGNTPQGGNDAMREFTRGLFASAKADE